MAWFTRFLWLPSLSPKNRKHFWNSIEISNHLQRVKKRWSVLFKGRFQRFDKYGAECWIGRDLPKDTAWLVTNSTIAFQWYELSSDTTSSWLYICCIFKAEKTMLITIILIWGQTELAVFYLTSRTSTVCEPHLHVHCFYLYHLLAKLCPELSFLLLLNSTQLATLNLKRK